MKVPRHKDDDGKEDRMLWNVVFAVIFAIVSCCLVSLYQKHQNDLEHLQSTANMHHNPRHGE